jgi:small conductance mechanosensitive channel
MENPLEQELESAQRIYQMIVDFFVNYSFQVIGAILILIAGYVVARYTSRLLVRFCERKNVDVTLRNFLGNLLYLFVLFCFVIISLGKFGISVAPFIAALGALTLGAGLALQGIVSNYGAGFAIILTRPFIVGNTISVIDVSGVVEEIKLATTILMTEDGERITIPNKHIVGEILNNSFEHKLVETIVGIDYSADPDKAITAISNCLAKMEGVTKEPPPQIGVDGFGESSIDIGVRFWVPTSNYFQSKYRANLAIFKALQTAGIAIPFPRRDVQLLNSASS